MFSGITCFQIDQCLLIILALVGSTLALCTMTDEGKSNTETYEDPNNCGDVYTDNYGLDWKCQENSSTVIVGPTTFFCENSSFQELYSFYNTKDTKIHFIVKNSSLNSLISDGTTWTRLTELSLDYANITTIIPGFFNGFTELSVLNITTNKIPEIVDGVFSSLKNLQKLNLSQNSIIRLGLHAFLGLSVLEMLDLSKNKILVLPENIFLPLNNSLTYIDLSVNNITLLRSTLKLSRLQNIYLKYNKLNEIDYSNYTKGTLKVLDISYNNLKNINNLDVIQAEVVNLSFNNLTSVKKIGSIRILNIRGNCLKVLEEYFASESTTELDLSFNVISNISSASFAYGNNLKTLNLSGNFLEALPTNCFRNLKVLQNLDLSGNKILQLQFGIFNNLKELKYLNLSQNRGLIDFRVFLQLSFLKNLNFQTNEIKNFDEFFFQTHRNLKQVTMGENSWKCGELANIIYLMEMKYNISVAKGNSDESSNIRGVTCSSDFKNEVADIIGKETLQENKTREILKDLKLEIRNATNLKYFKDIAERFLKLTEKLFHKNETHNDPSNEHLVKPKQVSADISSNNISMNISLGICNFLLLLILCVIIIFIIIYLKRSNIRIRKDEVELVQ